MSLKRYSNSLSKKLSTSSTRTRKPSAKEEEESFMEECESIYLSVMNGLDEEISSSEELTLLLRHAGCNPSKKIIDKYWGPKIDSYSFNQFCSILKQEEKTSKKDLLKAFQKIDRNGDSFITHDELYQILTKRGERMTKAEVKMMIDDADYNGDGKLDYEEFCDMMETTSQHCKQLHLSKVPLKSSSKKGSLRTVSPQIRKSQVVNKSSRNNSSRVHEEKINSVLNEEKNADRKSSRSSSIISKLSTKEAVKREPVEKNNITQKLKAEPQDLNRWQFYSAKGCFYKEEDGRTESHHFQLKVTQPASVWITIKSSPPKYGKFDDEILASDMTLLLVEDGPGSKLVAFSNSTISGKYCLHADVDIGVYTILTFTSGNKLYVDESTSGDVSLVKGSGDEARLTKTCKDTLMEIFYRCDLDGNGYLNREEFNQFQMRSSGEGCDDEAWDIVKETIEVTPHSEITPNGFLTLNLMEARDPDGGQEELWVTLESMGYSRKLQLSTACPFQLEVFTKRGKNNVSLIGVSDGGEPLRNAINDAIKMISTVKSIKNKRDLHLHVAEFEQRMSLAVDNQSHSIVGIRVDCSSSENLVSDQGSLDNVEDIEPKSMKVIHHLTPTNDRDKIKLCYQESVMR